MPLPIWRAIVWCGLVLGFALAAYALSDLRHPQAYSGVRLRYVGGPQRAYSVAHVDPGSPADLAGIRAGDMLRLPDNRWENQLEVAPTYPGGVRTFIDRRGAAERTVSFVETARYEDLGLSIVAVFTGIVLLLGAGFIAARASNDRSARYLAAFFLFLALLGGGPSTNLPWPWLAATWWVAANSLFVYLAAANCLLFAATFPAPGGTFRVWIERLTVPITIVLVGLSVAVQAALLFTSLTATAMWAVVLYGFALYIAAAAVAFVLSYRRSRGADRQRIRWVAASLIFGLSGPIVWSLLASFGILDPRLDALQATIVAIPLGAGYAIVRHRVVDLGFVVNRALVFTIVSTIVVTSMGILEWILDKVVVERNHITSASFEIAFALALGYFLRRIQRRIDAFVDYVFFRTRHRQEAALRSFARDAHFITSLPVLLQRTLAALLANADPAFAGVWFAGGSGDYVLVAGNASVERVEENDPAVVRMRATREPTDPSELQSAVDGRLALPMPIRHSLSGFLSCGPKLSGDDYAPDEIEVLALVAREVGLAVDGLRLDLLREQVEHALAAGHSGEALRSVIEVAFAPPSRLETNQAGAAS